MDNYTIDVIETQERFMTPYQERAYHFLCGLLDLGVGFKHEQEIVVAVGTGVSPVLQEKVREWSGWIQHYIPPQGIAPDSRQDGSGQRPKAAEPKTAIQRWSENSVDDNGQWRDDPNRKTSWRNRGASSRTHGQAKHNGVGHRGHADATDHSRRGPRTIMCSD